MKPFNLEEYRNNPSRKVVTRDGRNVRIICTDRRGEYPIIALTRKQDNGEETLDAFTENGRWALFGKESVNDLFSAPEKHEGWISIYRGKDGPLAGNAVFTSKEEAEESKSHCCGFTQGLYMTSVKIEWEE